MKIRDYNINVGNYFALTSEGSHPSIDSRIEEIGKANPNNYYDINLGGILLGYPILLVISS